VSKITRRQFLHWLGALGSVGVGVAAVLSNRRWWEGLPTVPGESYAPEPPTPWSIEAKYYTSFVSEGSLNCSACHSQLEERLPVSYCHIPHTGSYVRCNLCPHHCIIADGERGTCRVRENRGGRLYSVVYGNPCAIHRDPIEKKPFFHYLPTATSLSLATAGCNLRCLYCQNWSISQVPPEETQNIDLPPEEIVRLALSYNDPVIAYTYSEPTIFYEYMLGISQLAREFGLRNVIISAGYIEPDPLRELCQYVDAIKIDLKGYDEEFYREVCGAELHPVLRAIETIFEMGIHLEIVNLVVPTLNDNLAQLKSLSRWVAQDLSPDVPLHFSRFQPLYKLANLPPTPVETLEKAYDVAREEGVRFVYIGNVPGHPGNNTYCPECGQPIIVRQGFAVLEYHLWGGVCEYCGEQIPGVWWPEKPEGQPIEVLPGSPDY
jgi:pyruvate formate lyase activating enzyme